MKKALFCETGARLPVSSPALYEENDDMTAASAAEAAAALATGEWNAAGLIYEGDLTLSAPASIYGLHVHGTVRVTSAAAGTTLSDCYIEGKVAVENEADGLSLTRCVLIYEEAGLLDRAKCGTLVRDCMIEGEGTAITTAAEGAQVMYNLVDGKGGIQLGGGVNMIAAMNDVNGPIAVTGARNTVVLKNNLCCATVKGCHAVCLVENELTGTLTATDNDYILADCNCVAEELVATGNSNENGNNLTDVEARPEVGADEALLPHVDKDLFVGMPRKAAVRDPEGKSELPFAAYVNNRVLKDEVVIVPPGAYCADEPLLFTAAASNTTVYAYGVYAERQKGYGCHIRLHGARNVTVKGLLVGFRQQSCGQVYVLEKLENNTMRVVTGAGMINDIFHDGIGAHRAGTFYAYCDTNFKKVTKEEGAGVPTMLMEVDPVVYEMTHVGDIFTSRWPEGSPTVILGAGCKNVVFYDLTLYGNAGGFAFVEGETLTSTTYYRVYDTTQNGPLIDEQTYRAYRALEEKYGVSLEISQDALGRYRGSLPHIGSVDATHTTNCAEGSQATFCVFENMCDDATNQNHMASRLHEIIDNGDGTTTLIYKGVLTHHMFRYQRYTPNAMCSDFKKGDRVYIYTADGQLLCDTKALSATVVLPDGEANDYGETTRVPMRSITVASGAVKMKPLEKFDLHLNTVDDEQKVLVDNMSMASNGFKFDNCKFQNIRSRGLLIKASDGLIRNCTFRHIGMSCAAILYEIFWGESGVTENLLVEKNLIDHTGYFGNNDTLAPVSITGLGSSVDEDFLLYRNIVFRENRIVNRTTDYAVYVNSAKDIKILDNYFGEFVGNDFTRFPEAPESAAAPKPVIHINAAMNIEIAGNRYPETGTVKTQVVAEHNKNVYGADVGELFPDQP